MARAADDPDRYAARICADQSAVPTSIDVPDVLDRPALPI